MTPRHFLVCLHVMISALNYIPATHNNVHLIKVSAQAPSRKKKGGYASYSYHQNGQSELSSELEKKCIKKNNRFKSRARNLSCPSRDSNLQA